jgi:hypothetical protein
MISSQDEILLDLRVHRDKIRQNGEVRWHLPENETVPNPESRLFIFMKFINQVHQILW